MSALPTVKIKHATNGFAIINASDFDPDSHELFGDEPKKAEPAAVEAKAEAKPVAKAADKAK